jgi:geranylgeranyl diphosphate synthase type II
MLFARLRLKPRSHKNLSMLRPHPKIMAFDLSAYLEKASAAVNSALDDSLPRATEKPATLHKAMRYSLFAGGKRMRPALCLAAAEARRFVGGRHPARLRRRVHSHLLAHP